MLFNPFSVITSKVFLGTTALFATLAAVQTVRIEGVFCRDVTIGEKPACVVDGFKQDLQVIRIDFADLEERNRQEVAAHKASKDAYEDAQLAAAEAEAQRINDVIETQKELTDEVTKVYRARLADARARADSLRVQAANRASAASAARGNAVPGASDAASGTDGAPGDNRLSLDERLIATEQAIQLVSLISWVEAQSKVRFNPEGDKAPK